MSGSIFGNVTPVAAPDFQRTQANALALMAQRRQMQQQDALQNFFENNAQGLSASDPAKRMNVLAMLAQQGGQGAAMALPMLNQERQRMEFQDIMRGAMGGDGAAPAAPPSAGGDLVSRLVQAESGGDPNARNPRSSATGAGQFIDSTWLQFANANPALFRGMSREQILAARNNPDLSRRAIEWYASENGRALAGAGLPVNNGTLALSHRFGAGDAARLLQADQGAPIASVVSAQVMRANPDLAGKTVGQVVGQYAQRFGGAAGGGEAPQGGGNAATIARMERAVTALTTAGRLEEASRLSAILNGLRRAPDPGRFVEEARTINGVEIQGQRNTATGQWTPYPGQGARDTPGPFGNERTGRTLQAIEELGPVVARGEATPEQLRRYASAVTDYQREEVRPDGSRVTPRLPPYAPGLDWVSNRYQGFRFDPAAATSPDQAALPPAPTEGAAAPASAPAIPAAAGDAAPAAPNLPPAGGTPALPGAQGGVTRNGAAMESGTRRQIEEQVVANQDALARLNGIGRSFRPEYQTFSTRWSNMWNSFLERGTGRLNDRERQQLRDYTQYRASALENLNRTIQETTGAAMGVEEARRIMATMPNPGTGLFDGDSPTEFQAKLDRALGMMRSALIRRHYALSRGLNPTETGIELDQIPRLYMRRAGDIESEIRQDNPGISAEELQQRTRARLRQEFGV